MTDRQSREAGPSRESSHSPSLDVARKGREGVDRSEEEQLKELQASLSHFRKYLDIKNERRSTHAWDNQPLDPSFCEGALKNYNEALEKLGQVEQWLPKLLLKEPSEAEGRIKAKKLMIEGIKRLKGVDFGREGISAMYNTLSNMHKAVQQLFSDDVPESSNPKRE